MFDDYLKQRDGDASSPFTQDDYDDYVDGKPRYDGVESFLASRDIDAARRARPPTTRRHRDASTASATARTSSSRSSSTTRASSAYPGSVDYVNAVREAGLRTAVVSSSANAGEVLEAAGIARPVRGASSTGTWSTTTRPARASRRPTRTCKGAEELGVKRERGGGVRGRARRASRPGAPATSAMSSASTGSARPTRSSSTAPTSSSRTSASCCDRMIRRRLPDRALVPCARPSSTSTSSPSPSRSSRSPTATSGLRGNLDEGEPRAPQRHLPQRLLRVDPAELRRERLRLPRGRPERGQRDRRQDHPAAGRGRAARRPPRAPAPPRARARLPRRHADALAALELGRAA